MAESRGTVLDFLRAVGSHWTTLMSGGIITVALGIFERLSGKNIPLWLYLAVLIFFAFLACFLAFRDSQKKQTSGDANARRQHFLGERLNALLKEAGEVYCSGVSLNTMEGMSKVWRETDHHKRAKNFVREHYGQEIADRYDKEKSRLLEELLADSLQHDEEPNRPKITGKIEEVIIDKLLPRELAGFDYYIHLRFWLRNTGARTNFHAFKLDVLIGETTHEAEKLSLAGYCLYRPEPRAAGAYTEDAVIQTKLSDYDADTPLDRDLSRPGWLRFVVRNVRWNLENVRLNDLNRLDLTVTDGSGRTWPFSALPPWKFTDGRELKIEPCPIRWEQLGGGGSRAYFQPRYR